MLSRYHMKRGVKKEFLPSGLRQDTRKHTRHILRPPAELVQKFLGAHSNLSWDEFTREYLQCITQRYVEDSAAFDTLAELARVKNVFLGCSCPTTANPKVNHCHTWLALEFMKARYSDLEVRFPDIEAT
ncbi:MAG: hypothetical protein P1V97_31025 [Planctomycetota bacterium]|nr:hypothetical protein [Planctomycetota bacterium]